MVNTPPIWPADMKTRPASTVLDWVLASSGAIYPKRDAVDTRIINDVKNGTGKIIDCVGPDEIIRLTGTSQSGSSSTTLVLENTSARRSNNLAGYKIAITSGTGAGQSRIISSYERTTNIIKVTPEWNKIPDTSSRYKIFCDCSANAGGWPEYAKGTPPIDADKDGIPNDWEQSHNLDPNNPSDGNNTNLSQEGYTNIEVYINSLLGGN